MLEALRGDGHARLSAAELRALAGLDDAGARGARAELERPAAG